MDTKRDWGYAPDYVEAMWLMLQQDEPRDYVIATGETHSLEELLVIAFSEIGITDWKKYVGQDERYMRPADVFYLAGDSSKAREELSWKPFVTFEEMVSKMVENDVELLSK